MNIYEGGGEEEEEEFTTVRELGILRY